MRDYGRQGGSEVAQGSVGTEDWPLWGVRGCQVLLGCPQLSWMVRITISQGHLRTRRDGELSSPWGLLKDVAAAAPDAQGSSQQHQVELPGFQQRLSSSALASSRAGLNSPLLLSAPQCCSSCSQSRGAPHRVPVGPGSRNTRGLSL